MLEFKEPNAWRDACRYMTEFNRKHNITVKGDGDAVCTMVAVISQDSFSKPYTEEQRSYRFSNHNKWFIPTNIGRSVFADCLDGTDPGVRLDLYIPDGTWKVDRVYIEKETE
jgi:hypothetical protein